MKIYLDDNLADPTLVGMLKKADHDVVLPRDVGLGGASDPRHLEHAVRQGLIVLTGDHEDFEDLDLLIHASGGSHPGMMIVRYDDDPKHNMRPKHIVAAVGNLERSRFVMTDQVAILNNWR